MIEALREALESLVWPDGQAQRLGLVYRGPADFVLREGKPYERAGVCRTGAPRACFGNSIAFATHNETSGWRYVEGYALAPWRQLLDVVIPIHHAWVVDADGVMYEPTWPAPGQAYLGVEFSVERADDATWNGDASVLDDWKRRWPLLRRPWRGEDLVPQFPPSPRLELLRRKARGETITREEYESAMADSD